MPPKNHVESELKIVRGGSGANHTEIKAAVLGADVGAPTKRWLAEHAAVGHQNLRRASPRRLAVDRDREPPRLEADQLGHGVPKVGRLAEPTFQLRRRVANHEGVDSDSNLREIVPAVDFHRVDARHPAAPRQERDGLFHPDRDGELLRQDIGGSQRNDAQWGRGFRHPLRHGGDRAVASGGDDQVETRTNRLADTFGQGVEAVGLVNLAKSAAGRERGPQKFPRRVEIARPRLRIEDHENAGKPCRGFKIGRYHQGKFPAEGWRSSSRWLP